MAYIKISTKQKITPAEIISENPNISFPAGVWEDSMLIPMGYATLYQPATHPFPANKYEQLVEVEPVLIDGKWTVQYEVRSVVPTDPVELAAFIESEKAKLKTEATSKRYDFEVGGVALPDGTVIKTDRESQATITGALSFLNMNPTATIDWKSKGSWVTLGLAQITAISNAVGSHVQQAFNNEKAHHEAIDALTTVEELLNYNISTGWYPVSSS